MKKRKGKTMMEKTMAGNEVSANYKTVYRFLFIEILCYAVFLFWDIFKGADESLLQVALWIKWVSIIGCFSFVAFHKPAAYRKKEKGVVSAALFFTVIADLFLLIINWSIVGVLCFIIVQTLYLYRLKMWNEGITFEKRIIGRMLCSMVIYLVFFLIGNVKNIAFLAIILYFVSLVDNITISASICFYHVGSKRKSGCFFAGLCLLFLCDIQVAICNVDMFPELGGVSLISNMMAFAEIAMWMFYLPSQVLIALSGRLEK